MTLAVAGMLMLPGITEAALSKAQEQRQIRNASNQTLARLYAIQPSARNAVQSAAGYAVFSNFGMKIMLAGGGSGSGMAVNNKTKAVTYMKMVEVQAGLGMGIKKFRQVWVFKSQKALDDFIHKGWVFGGQATASAKLSGQGASYQGAVAVAPDIWLYQLTGDSLALEVTAKGTKYYRDSDLN
jgi:lipid-binding SYLF domain-containing protein